MKNKWIKLLPDKVTVERLTESLKDDDRDQLTKYKDQPELEAHDKKILDLLKKRKLVTVVNNKSYKITKGDNFATEKVQYEEDLTAAMLRTGEWKDKQFKSLNFNAVG